MITQRSGQQVACDGVRVAWLRTHNSSTSAPNDESGPGTGSERFSIDGVQVLVRPRAKSKTRLVRTGARIVQEHTVTEWIRSMDGIRFIPRFQ